MARTWEVLSFFVLGYPVVMAVTWMVGGLYFWVRRERGAAPVDQPPDLPSYPPVTVLVPMHNEGPNAVETITAALEQRWPDLEVIAVDDGSTDATGRILDELATQDRRLRVIHLATNQGKAAALRVGAVAARSEYLVCVDGDALLDEHAVHWMMTHLANSPRVGAVAGNPRIRNRSTLLGKLQVGEFSSIVGIIKRSQRTYGRLFTVSGVVAGFRRTALHRVGYWSQTALTEDIDISWRLQMDHWDVRFEPRALCAILTPETVNGLWRQRLRWVKGGTQAALEHTRGLGSWRRRRMWPIVAEYYVSVTWAFSVAVLALVVGLGAVVAVPGWAGARMLGPGWTTVMLATVCMLQFAVSMIIDRRYEPRLGRLYFWMIWYPLAYWVLNLLTTLVAVPSVLFGERGGRAVWTSPDRGLVR